jgi:hypothetical protein
MTSTTKKVLTGVRLPSLPLELTLQQEIRSLGEDGLMEFMNLTSQQTGIDGILFVSTAMGQHGPRVKYFVKAGKDQPSFSVSISAEPQVLDTSLPDRVTGRVAPEVIEWVKLNRVDLLRFWQEGETWTIDEVHAFGHQLKKVSSEKS